MRNASQKMPTLPRFSFRPQSPRSQTASRKESDRFGYAVLTPKIEAKALSSVLSKYVAACKSLSKAFGIEYADLADNPELTPIYIALEGLTQASKRIGGARGSRRF